MHPCVRSLPLLILATFMAAVLADEALPLPPGATASAIIRHDGSDRLALVHAPAGAAAQRLPLVLALHGGSGDAVGTEQFTAFSAIADRERFIVAYPQGTALPDRRGFFWNDDRLTGTAGGTAADDVGFVRELIDRLVAQGAVDPGRVFVTGISNGAMMSFRIARELPDRVAAIAAVAGHLPLATPVAPVPGPPVAVAVISGTEDSFMPFAGGEITAFGIPQRPSLGFVRSAEDTVARWVAADRAGPIPAVERGYGVSRWDGCTVTSFRYAAQPGGADVWFVRIDGGGHTWPGSDSASMRLLGRACRDIDASDEIWRFFAAHGRARPG
nr:hypothetical protein [Planctomycetota bacterium]